MSFHSIQDFRLPRSSGIEMRRFRISLTFVLFPCLLQFSNGQPQVVDGGVRFTYVDIHARSAALVGDFNGWSKDENPMMQGEDGYWSVVKKLRPGIYQYKFVVDGERYETDPVNPATIDNFNKSAKNSVFVLTDRNEIVFTSTAPEPPANPVDNYPTTPDKKPIYLNIIWHQHQPLYVNPETDQLEGPWVRTHATKDYFDMAAMLQKYPNVHCTINLTSSLLHQLRDYYIQRLKPYIDTRRNRVDVDGFLKRWKGKTDPWIDLALKPTSQFSDEDKRRLYRAHWNAFGISEVMINRFPEYALLKERLGYDRMPQGDPYSEQEMREIKFWFYLAYFDPDFLLGPVKLPDGSVCDLSSYVEYRGDKKFYLKKKITEADCQRVVAESYKVMANIIPIHKKLQYSTKRQSGQIEIITTPYYHPILPLIYDSDIARNCQPNDPMPARFSYPQDARAQVEKSIRMYKEVFGTAPVGMWPGEGAVAQPILGVLRENGIIWTASDVKVLTRSDPPNQPNTTVYRFPANNADGTNGAQSIAMVFRDTELSDRIGFKYQTYRGEEAAEDFVQSILSFAPSKNQDDVLITVILDGENAWEWYKEDMDGKEFLHALYRKLSKLFDAKQVIPTTTSEYLEGNPKRGVRPHPLGKQSSMKQIWPGSWINANYDTWIGEPEENRAWEYLLRVRKDLEKSDITQPNASQPAPTANTRAWFAYMAWESMYAAEGSDWFWWYGRDQEALGGDKPFDDAFRTHLNNVYTFARKAGASIQSPGFDSIIPGGHGSFEARSSMMKNITDLLRGVPMRSSQ